MYSPASAGNGLTLLKLVSLLVSLRLMSKINKAHKAATTTKYASVMFDCAHCIHCSHCSTCMLGVLLCSRKEVCALLEQALLAMLIIEL